MKNIESKVMEKNRFGLKNNEITTLCEMSDEGSICTGVSCPLYQRCWEYLSPDENGYFITHQEGVMIILS